jgi:hypothetical protein
MDEDNTSSQVVETTETPAEDPILSSLSDTEDESVDQKPADSVEETSEETETEAEAEPEAEQTEEDTTEVEPEVDPKEEARRRYEERQRVIQERRARVQDQTQDYVKQGEDEYDQRLRSMEVQQYSALIENNENTLINEFERVKANPDLQIFNPESDQFNERIYDKAIRDYNAGYVGYDQNGNMTEIKGSLFAHLTETAELFQGAVKSGAVQQVRAAKKMQSTADTKPAATPKEQAKDNILDILKSD